MTTGTLQGDFRKEAEFLKLSVSTELISSCDVILNSQDLTLPLIFLLCNFLCLLEGWAAVIPFGCKIYEQFHLKIMTLYFNTTEKTFSPMMPGKTNISDENTTAEQLLSNC